VGFSVAEPAILPVAASSVGDSMTVVAHPY
jgi:hypothetical protein